ALICGLVLTVKAALQQFDWYAYVPHAFLHPAALQIQGTVLALFCLAWLALRLFARVERNRRGGPPWPPQRDGEQGSPQRATPTVAPTAPWLIDGSRLLDSKYVVDRFVLWALVPAFLLLAVYGSLSGITQEIAGYPGFNIAGFPHAEALGLGSWIVLGLLLIAMLASFWECRHHTYLLGAIAILAGAIPLLAGQFETQLATATAWRWLAATFPLIGSIAIWSRRKISKAFIEEARPLLFV